MYERRMLRLKRFKKITALALLAFLLTQTVHLHAHTKPYGDHNCVVCKTPSLTPSAAASIAAPTYIEIHKTIFSQAFHHRNVALSPVSPRAPPAL